MKPAQGMRVCQVVHLFVKRFEKVKSWQSVQSSVLAVPVASERWDWCECWRSFDVVECAGQAGRCLLDLRSARWRSSCSETPIRMATEAISGAAKMDPKLLSSILRCR